MACSWRSFGGETLTELRTALAEAEIAETGGLSPRVAPMAEVRQMGALLQRAGLALPVADALRNDRAATAIFGPDARSARDGRDQRADRPAPRPRPARLFARRAAAIYAERFGDGDGRIRATFELIFLTGWAPARQPAEAAPTRQRANTTGRRR
jgi:hypothetical protein